MANLPEAPALNLSNPSISAAEGYASGGAHAYAAGLQFATALREAAAQQEKLAQQQKFEQAKADQQKANEYATETGKLREMGGTLMPQYDPANVNGTASNDGRPTLRRDQSGVQLDSSQQVDPRYIQTDSQGHAWDMSSVAKRQAQQGFIPAGKLKAALDAQGAQLGPGATVPWATLHDLMIDNGLAAPPSEEQDISSGYQDTEGNPVTVAIGRKTGTAKQVKLPEGVSPKTKPESSTPHFAPDGVLGPNQLPLIEDPENPGTFKEITAPAGSKRQLTPGQEQAAYFHQENMERLRQNHEDAQTEAQRRDVDRAQANITQLQVKEQEQHGLRDAYGGILATPNKESFRDPKSGKTTAMTDAVRKVYQQKFDDATSKVGVYHDAQVKIMKRFGGESDSGTSANAGGATPAQTAPAAPAKAQTGGPQQTPAQAPPVQGAGTQQPKVSYQTGAKRSYQGANYTFDGKQWVRD